MNRTKGRQKDKRGHDQNQGQKGTDLFKSTKSLILPSNTRFLVSE